MIKKYKPLLSVLLVLIAISVAAYYLTEHHSLVVQLVHTPPLVVAAVLALYAIMFGVLVLILKATVNICNKQITQAENSQLNANSLFINFFVPGQGGPIYRGVYLYKKHRLKVKNYIIATLIYYVIYAVISIFMLSVAVRPWWQTTSFSLIVAGGGIVAVKTYSQRVKLKKHSLNLGVKAISYLLLATLAQALIQAIIYAVELHSVNNHISPMQIVTYTGAANLALFVALTPGAIGIRESFLIFTRNLHHISSANIVIANVIDRSVYLVFLLILIALSVAIQMRGKFQFKKVPVLLKQILATKNTSTPTVRNN
jgi:uncharacterized membrane protein YbhN (UPF0104 family)